MVKTKEELCLAPTLSTIAGLRRAVCIDPHDDTVRFALADSLEEPGSSEQERKWAALIRFQIALTTYGDGSDPAVARLIAGTNEPALLRDLTPWLRRGERCERCKGKGMLRKRATRLGGEEHRCPTCHGTGWLGSLAESSTPIYDAAFGEPPSGWLIPATFSRGFVSRVELTAAQVQDAAFLRRLFAEWPIVEAGLVGAAYREPHWDEAAASATIVSLGRAAAGLPQIGVAS